MNCIGNRAFTGVKELVIYMPYCVTDIANDAFEGCTALTFLCEAENTAAAFAKTNGIHYIIAQIQ